MYDKIIFIFTEISFLQHFRKKPDINSKMDGFVKIAHYYHTITDIKFK